MSTMTLAPLPQHPEPQGLAAQFAHPRGSLGRWVGRLMALKNRPMNARTVEAMQVAPTDRVLEVGFGAGWTVDQLARRATRGMVAGVDVSSAMLELAKSRNARHVEAGRVELVHGCVSVLPFSDGVFHKVCAVNNVQFWPEEDGLREVYRVLRPLGRLVLGIRRPPRDGKRGLAPGFDDTRLRALVRDLEQAGFVEVHTELHSAVGPSPWARDMAVVYADKPYFVAATSA